MNPPVNLNLPDQLKPYEEAIANTIKPYLRINITPNSTQLWQSKFGGFPYLPKNVNYPTNSQGKYLQLLAQINFSEIPPLPNFPTQGILQFYIDGNDGLYGLNFDHPTSQDGFKMIYFETIDQNLNNLVNNFGFLENNQFFPIRGEFSLSFTHCYSPITLYDFRFEQYFLNYYEDNLLEIYDHWFSEYFKLEGSQHKLGGYPDFVQEDPRFNPDYQDYILLLQVDSDYDPNFWPDDICWGDAGIGNFFIKPKSLKSLDFSDVLYNWDCS